MQKCTKCGDVKPLSEFSTDNHMKNGKRSFCKKCRKLVDALRKDEINATRRLHRLIPEVNARIKRQKKIYNKVHSQTNIARVKKWQLLNPEKRRALNKKVYTKIRSTALGKLNHRLSVGVRQSLRKNKSGWHWELLVGYTLAELKAHLEKQFTAGMTWENIGQWHIDHKIPKAAFNFETPDDIDFKRCWGLKNLQPLWAKENFKKRDKLEGPFQPSLLIRQNEKL